MHNFLEILKDTGPSVISETILIVIPHLQTGKTIYQQQHSLSHTASNIYPQQTDRFPRFCLPLLSTDANNSLVSVQCCRDCRTAGRPAWARPCQPCTSSCLGCLSLTAGSRRKRMSTAWAAAAAPWPGSQGPSQRKLGRWRRAEPLNTRRWRRSFGICRRFVFTYDWPKRKS